MSILDLDVVSNIELAKSCGLGASNFEMHASALDNCNVNAAQANRISQPSAMATALQITIMINSSRSRSPRHVLFLKLQVVQAVESDTTRSH
jgi:hypothetical protein